MEHLYIRGHPPWYARGTPVVKLRDEPHAAIRGKPLFNGVGQLLARGNPPYLLQRWCTIKEGIINRQKGLYGQWYAQFVRLTCQPSQNLTTSK